MAKPGTVTPVGVRCYHCGIHCDPSNKKQVSDTLVSHTCSSHPLYETTEGVLLWSDEVTDPDVLPECEFVWGPLDW